MTKEERIEKYNPYTTEHSKDSNKLHNLLMKLKFHINFHDVLCVGYDEYVRYVHDSIDLNEVPIKYDEWIREQSHKYEDYEYKWVKK